MIIKITTDGSCEPNPGKGGWAAIFRFGDKAKAIFGYEISSTNNRMELTAAIKALQYLKHGNSDLNIFSDSQYLVFGIQSWILKWKRKDLWHTIKNPDLWKTLDNECQRHKSIQWKWVKGHATDEDNILCDELATKARIDNLTGELDINKFQSKIISNPKYLEISG